MNIWFDSKAVGYTTIQGISRILYPFSPSPTPPSLSLPLPPPPLRSATHKRAALLAVTSSGLNTDR